MSANNENSFTVYAGDLGETQRRYEGVPETEEPMVLPQSVPPTPEQLPLPTTVPAEPERVEVG